MTINFNERVKKKFQYFLCSCFVYFCTCSSQKKQQIEEKLAVTNYSDRREKNLLTRWKKNMNRSFYFNFFFLLPIKFWWFWVTFAWWNNYFEVIWENIQRFFKEQWRLILWNDRKVKMCLCSLLLSWSELVALCYRHTQLILEI